MAKTAQGQVHSKPEVMVSQGSREMSRAAGGEVNKTIDDIEKYELVLSKIRKVESELAQVKSDTSDAINRKNFNKVVKLKEKRAELVKEKGRIQDEIAILKPKAKALKKLRGDHGERNSEKIQLDRQRTRLMMEIVELLKSIDRKLS